MLLRAGPFFLTTASAEALELLPLGTIVGARRTGNSLSCV